MPHYLIENHCCHWDLGRFRGVYEEARRGATRNKLLERASGLQHLGDIAMPPVLTAVQALNSGLFRVDDLVAPV